MSDRPLPPYTHIPGVTPHPLRDPAGHSYRGDAAPDTSLSPQAPLTWANLLAHPEFQWAVRLFNAGYYWESHEAWEALWHAASRTGGLADFLKGLIKLAAAGVKLREHNRVGVERHARRALELFREVQGSPSGVFATAAQLPLPELIAIADQLGRQPPPLCANRTGEPQVALPPLPPSMACSSPTG